TGEARYGPAPFLSGMQLGTLMRGSLGFACHGASFKLSQPPPGPTFPPVPCLGLSPQKPSRVAAASSRCPPQVDDRFNSKVRSEMTYRRARAAMLGMAVGSAAV